MNPSGPFHENVPAPAEKPARFSVCVVHTVLPDTVTVGMLLTTTVVEADAVQPLAAVTVKL